MLVDRAPREVAPGRIVANKYRIERVIAAGGQGTVVEATHLRLRQSVAIKFPHVAANDLLGPVERMFREARAAFRLQGAHVARTIDVDLVGGAPFIVMEYLRGVDLKAYIAQRGPLPVADAVGLLLQACEAVGEAHDLGIIHRDLKPSNMFLVDRPDGSLMLKVLDFGLSKAGIADPAIDLSELTEPERMLGSPRYMSPEQVRDSRDVDARSDIWSLGVILQELLTGAPMFRARTQMEALALVLTRSPAPVSILRPDVPPEIERAVLRCLQKIREHRFDTVRDLAYALAPHAPPWAVTNVERMLPGLARRATATASYEPVRGVVAPAVPANRKMGAMWFAVLVGLVIVGTVTWAVGRDRIARFATGGAQGRPARQALTETEASPPPVVVEPIAAQSVVDHVAPPAAADPPAPPVIGASAPPPSREVQKRAVQRGATPSQRERSSARGRRAGNPKRIVAAPSRPVDPPVLLGDDGAGPLEGRK